MRYRLRTLLMVLAVLPPLIAAGWWGYAQWQVEQQRRAAEQERQRQVFNFYLGIMR